MLWDMIINACSITIFILSTLYVLRVFLYSVPQSAKILSVLTLAYWVIQIPAFFYHTDGDQGIEILQVVLYIGGVF